MYLWSIHTLPSLGVAFLRIFVRSVVIGICVVFLAVVWVELVDNIDAVVDLRLDVARRFVDEIFVV
jgi:hypothetical protein